MKTESKEISENIILRRLKEKGAFYGYPSLKPYLSEQNRQHRLNWYQKFENYD